MVDDTAACRRLLHPTDEMHQHGLTGATPPDNPQDLPLGNFKRDIFEYSFSSKSMQRFSTVINGAFIILLYPNVVYVSYYLLYAVHHSRHDRVFLSGVSNP